MTVAPLAQRLPAGVVVRGWTYEAARAAGAMAWLSSEERARVESFGAESRRRDFVAGRAAARAVLAEQLRTSPADVPLRRAEDGAVDVVGTEWCLSIAHSDARALAAVARGPIGADLERIQARDPDLADFLLGPEERDLLATLPYDPDRALLLCWTLKEAALKARRSGFRASPKALRLSVDSADQTARASGEGETWRLGYAELDGFWAAVATPAATA